MKFSKATFVNGLTVLLICLGVLWLMGPCYYSKKPANTKTVEAPMQVEIAPLSDQLGSIEIKIDESLYQMRYDGDSKFTIVSAHPDTAVKILFVSHQPGSSTYYLPYELGEQISATDLVGTGISTVTVRFAKPRREVQCSVAVAVGSKVSSLRPLGTCS